VDGIWKLALRLDNLHHPSSNTVRVNRDRRISFLFRAVASRCSFVFCPYLCVRGQEDIFCVVYPCSAAPIAQRSPDRQIDSLAGTGFYQVTFFMSSNSHHCHSKERGCIHFALSPNLSFNQGDSSLSPPIWPIQTALQEKIPAKKVLCLPFSTLRFDDPALQLDYSSLRLYQ
jgi:hypothetical protein